jgi:hypothetical protein
MEISGMGAFLEIEKREVSHQEQVTRNELFGYLEAERKKMVEVLQEDIAQLVAIAKIKLSDNNSSDVENCLAMALLRLRTLSFEVKPRILEEFGLSITLHELMASRLDRDCRAVVNEIPTDIGHLMETAMFRLVQETLNTLPTESLSIFSLEILRTTKHLCLKNSFTLKPNEYSLKQINMLMDQLFKAIKPIVYLFNGKVVFQCYANKDVDVVIYLNEPK